MAESTIITGQFVRISQTPASIGERLLALVIDYSLIVIYLYSVTTLIVKLHLSSGVGTVFFLCLVYLPVLFYSFLCEMFNHGQSFGKRLMNIRVVITRTLESGEKDSVRRVTLLAKKVQEILSVTPRENNQEKFLQTVLRDYQYYALEEI